MFFSEIFTDRWGAGRGAAGAQPNGPVAALAQITPESTGVPVLFLWCSCGVPVVFLWCSCGVPVVLHWDAPPPTR